jgi:hypothetical protein
MNFVEDPRPKEMSPRVIPVLVPRALRFSLVPLLALGSVGCAAEGVYADCPDMPVTEDPLDPELAEWREEAEAQGCVTPRGEPLEPVE